MKECLKGKILNPATNRCVNVNGKIGKLLVKNGKRPMVDLPNYDNRCPEGKLLNPETNRCVSTHGKIGKTLLTQMLPNVTICPNGTEMFSEEPYWKKHTCVHTNPDGTHTTVANIVSDFSRIRVVYGGVDDGYFGTWVYNYEQLDDLFVKLKKLKVWKLEILGDPLHKIYRQVNRQQSTFSKLPKIGQFTEMLWLDIKNTSITTVPAIGNLKKLKGLNLSNNKIKKFPAKLSKAENGMMLF